jgi:hypothetical protein
MPNKQAGVSSKVLGRVSGLVRKTRIREPRALRKIAGRDGALFLSFLLLKSAQSEQPTKPPQLPGQVTNRTFFHHRPQPQQTQQSVDFRQLADSFKNDPRKINERDTAEQAVVKKFLHPSFNQPSQKTPEQTAHEQHLQYVLDQVRANWDKYKNTEAFQNMLRELIKRKNPGINNLDLYIRVRAATAMSADRIAQEISNRYENYQNSGELAELANEVAKIVRKLQGQQ